MTDYRQWKDRIRAAGLREARLHDARHTAATILLLLGQPERTVMSLMGWSTTSMATRYQHMTDQIRTEVASQVDSLIWAARTEGTAAETVTVRRDSLAAILPLVEDQLLTDDIDMTKLESALADLHTALSVPDTEPRGNA
jgi:site-specific recombinase XerD